MDKIKSILESNKKPKEKQQVLVNAVLQSEVSVDELISFFNTAKDTEKGTCADVMKHISAQKPEKFTKQHIENIARYIDYNKAPRVKWGVQETLGNLSKKFLEETAKTIPTILKNTTDNEENTTVIKWCAAYALTEMAKNNPKTRKELIPNFEKILKREENNGVKNVYMKALKVIEKNS